MIEDNLLQFFFRIDFFSVLWGGVQVFDNHVHVRKTVNGLKYLWFLLLNYGFCLVMVRKIVKSGYYVPHVCPYA